METMFKALVKGKKCLDTFEIKEIGIFLSKKGRKRIFMAIC